MRRMYAISTKELQLYFYSPTVYIVFSFYFLIVSYLFCLEFVFTTQIIDIRSVTGNMMFIYLFMLPLLTMRLVSDELQQGTDELLLTSPASITEIVLGKYIAALIVQLALIVISLIYPLIMLSFGELDLAVFILSYVGLFLLGAAMIAIGLFASTLSSHQMVSGIIAFALMLVFWMLEWLGDSLYGTAKRWVKQFALGARTAEFQKGLLDLSDLLFMVAFIVFFIVLSIRMLDRKRWG